MADQRVKNTKQALATRYGKVFSGTHCQFDYCHQPEVNSQITNSAHRCQMSRVWFAWTIYINVRRTKRRKCRTAQQFATATRKR